MKKVFREIKQNREFFTTNYLTYPAHVHEDIELVYVIKGGGTAFCDGKKYPLVDRSFFLVFPNQVHRYEDCDTGSYILLTIKPSNLLSNRDRYMKGHPTTALWTMPQDCKEPIINLLELALNEYNCNGHSTVVEALLTAFFEKLVPHFEIKKEKISNDTVLRILQYCQEHYKEDISVSVIANDLRISKSTVSHIFSSRLAISFCDHINTLRLNDAVNLLKSQNYTITEISDLAGFPTIRTFNRVFQKQYGVSPSDYRNQHHA